MKKIKTFTPLVKTDFEINYDKCNDEINLKLEQARKLIREARKLAVENDINFEPINSLFSDDQITDELGEGWNSSNC